MVRMPRLGRPISVTLGLAILALGVIYGGMEIWPRIESYRRMRALDRLWRDRSLPSEQRVKAAEMLAEFGQESASYLVEAARDGDIHVRERAYAYLGGLEPVPEEGFALCLSAMRGDREPRGRASAAVSLGSVAYADREGRPGRRRLVLDALAEAGHDESPMVRHAAMRGMIGAHAVEIDVTPWLADADRSVRLAAAEALLWLDPARKERMVPILQAMILQAGPERAGELIPPLALLYRADPPSCRGLVPTFVAWLRHEDAEVRARVVVWLARLGPVARDAGPALEAMLDRGPPADRARAAFAIISVDPTRCDRAAACLLALLGDASIHPRERGLALHPFEAMFRQSRVPARLRDEVLTGLRTIPDQPDIHPQLGLRIRQFIEHYSGPQPPAGPPGASARFISAH